MKNKKAFTLVELLIVVAIIGVLMSLLMPAMSTAKTKVTSMKSKTFLVGLASALDVYESEYACFPDFLSQRDRINLNSSMYAENLVKTLSGKNPEGRDLSTSEKKDFNRDSKRFLDFNDENLVQRNGSTKWSLVDAFGNPNIYVCVDDDGDGLIDKGFPSTTDGLSAAEVKEKVPNRNVGLRASAILFTLKKDENDADADFSAENVYSW